MSRAGLGSHWEPTSLQLQPGLPSGEPDLQAVASQLCLLLNDTCCANAVLACKSSASGQEEDPRLVLPALAARWTLFCQNFLILHLGNPSNSEWTHHKHNRTTLTHRGLKKVNEIMHTALRTMPGALWILEQLLFLMLYTEYCGLPVLFNEMERKPGLGQMPLESKTE